MAASSKIMIMISSRCDDPFPIAGKGVRRLSDSRTQLKAEIDAVTVFGQPLYEVWINEQQAEDSGRPAWDHCMEQARDCDMFIALFNGNAGWADQNGTIGICHAELEAAYAAAPGKIFVVNIHEPAAAGAPCSDIDLAFQAYVTRRRRFDLRPAATENELLFAVAAIPDAMSVAAAREMVGQPQPHVL